MLLESGRNTPSPYQAGGGYGFRVVHVVRVVHIARVVHIVRVVRVVESKRRQVVVEEVLPACRVVRGFLHKDFTKHFRLAILSQ